MAQLLSQYPISEIIIILVMTAIALKGVVTFFEWAWDKLKGIFGSQLEDEQEIENIKCTQIHHQESLEALQTQMATLVEKMDTLLESDRDQLKAELTRQHHYFMRLGKIDDYSLSCLEKLFDHYQKEGGNSFIAGFMEDLRNLPIASVEGHLV